MTNYKEMSPEVLIYIQTMKKFITTNNDARRYFDINGNEDTFLRYLSEISQKNFEEHGEPELDISQLEEIRKKLVNVSDDAANEITGVFLSMGNLGFISLN